MSFQLAKQVAVWTRAAGILMGAALAAQVTTPTVNVYPNVEGPRFMVDGLTYQQGVTLTWAPGTGHLLSTQPEQYHPTLLGTRYDFQRWVIGDGAMESRDPYLDFTATPDVSSIRLDFTVTYRIRLRFNPCTGPGCELFGVVTVSCGNTSQFASDGEIWCPAGSTVNLTVQPSSGYAFLGWRKSGVPDTPSSSFVLDGPTILYPQFTTARKIHLLTEPANLLVKADETVMLTPATLEWGQNTKHTLAAVSPQEDAVGKLWVLGEWSNGGPATQTFDVGTDRTEVTLTARFVPGARFTFRTNPAGFKLRVDGRDDWPGTTFVWGVGETHTVEAPARFHDSQGQGYLFTGWTNRGPAAQTITVTPEHALVGVNMTAFYEAQGGVQLRSSEPGVTFTVEGEGCPAPCSVERSPGTEVQVSAPLMVETGEGMRLEFVAWSDGAPRERTVTPAAEFKAVTAIYRVMLRLVTAADPPEAALWHFDPASPDGYYEAGSNVTLTVEPQSGYRFRKWEGDLSGAQSSGTLTMDAPKAVRALLEVLPSSPILDIRNAAGETPVDAVAPGSAISIYGTDLADAVAVGPDSPLAQSIGEVTVRMGDRLLPIFFVSPEQINVQLPSDIEPGEHTLTVWRDKSEAGQADFVVARNAPGLFQTVVQDSAWAVASHADGSGITQESPARRGEIVTVYGTGFGPTDPRIVDGFAVPDAPAFPLADPVEILAGELVLQPLWIGAAPGRVALNVFRLMVGPELPSGAVPLTLRVNGVESNSVLLAVE